VLLMKVVVSRTSGEPPKRLANIVPVGVRLFRTVSASESVHSSRA
jgi:hypothetical protein